MLFIEKEFRKEQPGPQNRGPGAVLKTAVTKGQGCWWLKQRHSDSGYRTRLSESACWALPFLLLLPARLLHCWHSGEKATEEDTSSMVLASVFPPRRILRLLETRRQFFSMKHSVLRARLMAWWMRAWTGRSQFRSPVSMQERACWVLLGAHWQQPCWTREPQFHWRCCLKVRSEDTWSKACPVWLYTCFHLWLSPIWQPLFTLLGTWNCPGTEFLDYNFVIIF